MWGELARVTRLLGDDDTVRGVIYRGAGRQAFASGADISEFREEAFESQGYKEGTRAFLEKRRPRFQGR